MSSQRLEDCSTAMKAAWAAFNNAFVKTFPGWKLEINCTYRPPEEQLKIFKKGRIHNRYNWVVLDKDAVETDYDGERLLSFHNDYPARAIDATAVSPDDSKHTAIDYAKAYSWIWHNHHQYGLKIRRQIAPVCFVLA